MVRVAFIVEGASEKMLIESKGFRDWATQIGVVVCDPVIDAKGGGNLLPQNVEPMIDQVKRSKPDRIVILTDLEHESTVEAVRTRIGARHTDDIFVAVKALEAWFLADTGALRHWLKVPDIYEEFPERTPAMPWGRLVELANSYGSRGPGPSKPKFARKYIGTHGFEVFNAAQHPNCPSAQLFCRGLVSLAQGGA